MALLLSGRTSDAAVDVEGFAEFIGGSLAVVGLVVLAAAVAGIVLAIRVRRGGHRARAGLGVLFLLFATVSGTFLASALADESGVDVGAAAGFGLNTAACLAVLVSAVAGRPG